MAVDIKSQEEFEQRKIPGGQTDRLAKRQAQFGCEYHKNMWDDEKSQSVPRSECIK